MTDTKITAVIFTDIDNVQHAGWTLDDTASRGTVIFQHADCSISNHWVSTGHVVPKHAPKWTTEHANGAASEYYQIDQDTRVTRVIMANGEIRYFVSVYNGYGAGHPEGCTDPRKFACAWSPSTEMIFPDGEPERTVVLAPAVTVKPWMYAATGQVAL